MAQAAFRGFQSRKAQRLAKEGKDFRKQKDKAEAIQTHVKGLFSEVETAEQQRKLGLKLGLGRGSAGAGGTPGGTPGGGGGGGGRRPHDSAGEPSEGDRDSARMSDYYQ